MNKLLMLGGLLGLTSVMMGAYIDHGLAKTLTENALHSMTSAQRYHQFYALVITCIGLTSPLLNKRFIPIAGWTFISGILLFSFGIYAAVIIPLPLIMKIVLFGGFLLMLGWVFLIIN